MCRVFYDLFLWWGCTCFPFPRFPSTGRCLHHFWFCSPYPLKRVRCCIMCLGGLGQETIILSPFWRPDSWNPGGSKAVLPPKALRSILYQPLGGSRQNLRLQNSMLHFRLAISSSIIREPWEWDSSLPLNLSPDPWLNHICKDPSSKWGHMHKFLGLG